MAGRIAGPRPAMTVGSMSRYQRAWGSRQPEQGGICRYRQVDSGGEWCAL